jgi:hypothetical protein
LLSVQKERHRLTRSGAIQEHGKRNSLEDEAKTKRCKGR